jgi:hypothetical protein
VRSAAGRTLKSPLAAPAGRDSLGPPALRRYRENLGLLLEDAAEVLDCDRSKISRIEAGSRGISVENRSR